MQVVFRVDSSIVIGSGHVMRCLALADELHSCGTRCHFVTRDVPGNLAELIISHGHKVSILNPPSSFSVSGLSKIDTRLGVTWDVDLAETRSKINGEVDWLIIDHYGLGENWEKGIADQVKNIMIIDDLADRFHSADLLLDQNLGRKAIDYDKLVLTNCKRLIGPQYALLRPEFSKNRSVALSRLKRSEVKTMLIAMGGTDPRDFTTKVLRALEFLDLPDDLEIKVVLEVHPHRLREYAIWLCH